MENPGELIGRAIEAIKTQEPSRHRSLAITKLEEALMWLQRDTSDRDYPSGTEIDEAIERGRRLQGAGEQK